MFSFFSNNILHVTIDEYTTRFPVYLSMHVTVFSFLLYSFYMQQSLKFSERELIPTVNFGFFLSVLHVIILSFSPITNVICFITFSYFIFFFFSVLHVVELEVFDNDYETSQ